MFFIRNKYFIFKKNEALFSFYLMMQFVIKFIFYRYNKNYPLLIQTI